MIKKDKRNPVQKRTESCILLMKTVEDRLIVYEA